MRYLPLGIAALIASIAAYGGYSPFGDIHWKAPVAATGSLPTSGNSSGDARVTTSDSAIYIWSGSAWSQYVGTTGSTGRTGATGATGSSGATGATGASGSTGASGASGASGLSGVSGATGQTGASGATGATGLSGASGASGLSGVTGASGNTCIPGTCTGDVTFVGNVAITGSTNLGSTLAVTGYVSISGITAYQIHVNNSSAQAIGLSPSATANTAVVSNGTNFASGSVIVASTYTPTLTNGTNVASSTTTAFQYLRVGATVTVSGEVTIDGTSGSANVTTVLDLTLPIASAFTASSDAAGSGIADESGVRTAGLVVANATDDRARFIVNPQSGADTAYYLQFTYQIK